MRLKEKFTRVWDALRPEQKKKVVMAAVLAVICLLGIVFYKSTRPSQTPTPQKTDKKRNIGVEPSKVLEKSLYNASQQSIGDLKKELEEMKKKMDEKEGEKKSPELPGNKDQKPDLDKVLNKDQHKSETKVPAPAPPQPPAPPPVRSGMPLPPGVPPAPGVNAAPSRPEVFGDIEMVSQRQDEADTNKGKKKEGMKIYLPPSFMEATLLSGMYAPTSTGASGSPLPVLIRIKNLAVLPNRVKGDLKGCFIIAEAKGSLADERAHVRLNTLSCLTKGGQSVIDQKVKGYAVDQDGFVGLRGNVVSKMGGAVARSLLAGFVVGFGEAINASSITTTTSGLGTTQTLDTDKAVTAGLGRGVSQAAQDIQKFLLDLGKQAVPVVEVGAMRTITVVISEGIELEIKERPGICMGGGSQCIK